MKVYLSADIEGVACIAAPSEADMSSPDYAPFREQMTAEVAAACAGAFDGGADAVIVKDAHGTARNIDPHRVSAPEGRSLQIIRGWSGHPFCMVQGIDSTFGMAGFVGYHSAASRGGNPLAHTFSGRLFSRIELNGVCASEFHLYALAAATVGVPVGFLSGDKSLCDEANGLIEGITTVATFEGAGPSVRSILPSEATARIRDGMCRAVGSPPPKLLPVPDRFVFKLEFARAHEAYPRSFYPGARQVSDREIVLETRNYLEVLAFLNIAAKMS
jgi:D-amino peptidase